MNNINDNLFLSKYREQMLMVLESLLPNLSEETIQNKLDKQISKKFKETTLSLVNNYRNTEYTFNASTLISKVLEGKMVLTGSGLLLKKQKFAKSAIAIPGNYLLDVRTKDKKLMLKYLNTNPELSGIYKNRQLVDKLLANSLFGVMAESNSIFYNLFTAEGILATGRAVITTVTTAFEKFFGNPLYMNPDTLYLSLSRQLEDFAVNSEEIVEKSGIFKDLDIAVIKDKLKNKISRAMYEYVFTVKENELLDNFISECSLNEAAFLFYQNNFFEFMRLPKITNILGKLKDANLLKIEPYINSEESLKDDINYRYLELLWKLSYAVVADKHFECDSEVKADQLPRRSILLVDTDSNFLYMDPFLKAMEQLFNFKSPNKETDISIINIGTFISVRFVKEVLNILTTNMFVQEDYRKEVRMKSEFFFERIILTSNKKNYSSKIIYQEGVLFDKPKYDIKGLTFNKSHVPKNTRDFFKKLLEEEFYNPKLNIANVLNAIVRLQNNIRIALLSGSLSYAENKQYNAADQYKNPSQMPVYRGASVWNYIYPSQPILVGEKCSLYKTTLTDPKQLTQLHKESPDLAQKLYDAVWKNEEISKYGMTYLAFPKSILSIPEWLIPFLDIDAVIHSNVSPGMVLLESLGIYTYITKNKKYYTNIIRI